MLGWVAGRYDRVHFPEYLQGFSGGGSLMAWTIRWSRANPWGWAVWHWVVIGLVALGFSAVRLGPPTPLGRGRRRSVTEHVQALARALRAAGGHQVAVGLLVGGLRRRLGPATGTRGSWRPWLDSLGAASTNPKVGELVRRLVICDREKPSESEVLTAANLVEDLWTELRS